MNKKVIYTCVTGGYDNLLQPKCVFEGFDYICFSNDFHEAKIGVWEIRPIPFKCKDKTRLSRFVKINPYIALPEYEYSLWIDSNLCILTIGLKDILESLIENDVLMASVFHPKYDCIYSDAIQCVKDGRDSYFSIRRQVNFLHSQKYPYHEGLYENNLIFRMHNNMKIKMISDSWWSIYMRYSKRDQLSLCYVLWQNKFSPVPFFQKGISTHNSECICRVRHNKKRYIFRVKSFILRSFNRVMNILFPVK